MASMRVAFPKGDFRGSYFTVKHFIRVFWLIVLPRDMDNNKSVVCFVLFLHFLLKIFNSNIKSL